MSEINLEKQCKEKKNLTFKNTMLIFFLVALAAFSFGLGLGLSKKIFNSPDQTKEGEEELLAKEKIIEYPLAENNISIIFEEVSKSVVAINASGTAQGSGIILDEDEENFIVITNYHVVEGAKNIFVAFEDERTEEAQLKGYDRSSDLAFLTLPKEELPINTKQLLKTAKLGDSDNLKVGEKVLAIGSPLGYKNSVTDGIISGLQRSLLYSDRRLSLIQTNAAFNPGNSGGALVNMRGEVIGINSVKLYGNELEGIAFAVPVNQAKEVYEEILEKGYIARPFLGIIGSDVLAGEENNLGTLPGVLVRGVVEDSAAFEAGIREGDLILEFNLESIVSMEALQEAIEKTKIDEEIGLVIFRKDIGELDIKVKIKERQ